MKYLSLGELFHRGRRPSGRTPGRKRARSRPFRSAGHIPLRLELLEDRTVPSALPTPTVTGQTDIMDNVNAKANQSLPLPFPSMNDFGTTENRSAPQVVADPLNPNKLVAVWVVDSVVLDENPSNKVTGPVVEGAYSTDGGTTWHTITWRNTSADSEGSVQGVPNPFAGTPINYPFAFEGQSVGLPDPRNELLRDPTQMYISKQNPLDIYGQWIQPSVAFDRHDNFYIVSIQASQDGGNPGSIAKIEASGAVILQKFNFSGNAPTRATLAATLDSNGSKAPAQVDTKVLYQWVTNNSAINPVIVVDANLRTYTDPTTGQVQLDPTIDATSGLGPIYVAWSTIDTGPATTTPDPFFNPNTIKVLVSSDGGNSFSSQVYANQGLGGNKNEGPERDTVPQIALSQGTATSPGSAPRVPGGQVNLVWHDSNPAVGSAVPTTENQIVTNAVPAGGAGFQFNGQVGPIMPALKGKSGSSTPVTTAFTDNVSLPAGQTFTKLDVTLAIVHPHLSQIEIQLSHGSTTITLVLNAVTSANATIMPAQGLADNGGDTKGGLGVLDYTDPITHQVLVDVEPVGATFDDQAPRSIFDMNTTLPYAQLNRPEQGTLSEFFSPNGTATASQLSGGWTLSITDFVAPSGTSAPVQFVYSWSLNFTAGMKFAGQVVPVSQKGGSALAPGDPVPVTPLTPSSQTPNYTQPVGATPVIASDNTLGSFSQFQGRLYLAYTGIGENFTGNGPVPNANDTDIFLLTSDDGGRTWQPASPDNALPNDNAPVNDDNINDGFSSGNRPQFEPQVAVDQSTGTLVVSFFDERYDAAQARPSMFVGASIDGGATFSPETFLNTPVTAIDAIKGSGSAPITLEPIPSDASEDPTFGLGNSQGLAVAGGHIVALWTGNHYQDNLPADLNDPKLDIWSGTALIASGPRVISADMGPIDEQRLANGVVYDNSFAPTASGNAGTRQLTGILVTFDRPVAISSFTPPQVRIEYRDDNGNATNVTNLVTSVIPVDQGPYGPAGVGFLANGKQILATEFLVRLTGDGSPGTYSYSIGPAIIDDIRQAPDLHNTAVKGAPGNPMDQDSDGQATNAIPDPHDAFYAPNPVNPNVGSLGFQAPYDPTTLPLIIPGPHVVDSFVKNGTSASDTNNLVLNGTVSSIDVVFDRDMNPASFTAADVLRIVSPAGTLTGISNPFTVTPDPNPGVARLINGVMTTARDPDSSHPRTYKISFGTQVLSGTYTVTLSSQIASKSGLQLDTNENGGLDILRNTPSPSPTPVTFAGSGGLAIPPGTTTAFALTIPNLATNNFANQGVSVELNITDPQDKNLRASLVAPDGTVVQLFTHVPLPTAQNPNGVGADFTNTIFNDNATAPIENATSAPFSGTFQPQEPLSQVSGKAVVGTWRLIIANDGASSPAGTLNSWSLTFQKPNPASGIGEAVADQATVSFRIFTMDPTNPLSHSTWTPVGPAGIDGGFSSSTVTDMEVDPSDPSGNIVYAATEGGGVWKTTDFLTTAASGPTWIPLTDFGPGLSINTGSIALLSRNGNPNQTVIYAATGAATDSGAAGFGSTLGVGILRSLDGGSTWTLEDSTTNVDANNNPLPINSSLRDHKFVGLSAFKVLVDPRIGPSGQAVVYAAFISNGTGASATTGNGGIYKSVDSGKHWTLISSPSITGTDPTDMVFAAGNPDILYASFLGKGVFVSHGGSAFMLMAGARGGDPLIESIDDDNPLGGAPSIALANSPNPNSAGGRISLAVPAPTGNVQQDLIYQNWVYAAVVNATTNRFDGLYVTKDGGQTWTKIRLPVNTPTKGLTNQTTGVPSNDDTVTANADVVANAGGAFGNQAISLAVDPVNPNVVYLGGETGGQPDPQGGLIRVDTTGLFDPYAFVPQNNHAGPAGSGGAFLAQTTGSIPYDIEEPLNKTASVPVVFDPNNPIEQSTDDFLNMQINPFNYFVTNATTAISEVLATPGFANNGDNIAGFIGIDDFASATNVFGQTDVVTNFHRIITTIDPLTHQSRLIIASDQGLYTAVDAGNGTDTELTSIGGTEVVNGPRTGNMQATQFNGGATQPSILAADIGQALFYGSTRNNGDPHSTANILTTGELDWVGPEDGSGQGVATDQTGTGYVYNFNVPINNGFGGQVTDFFDATPPPGAVHLSRTTGLFLTSSTNPFGPDTTDWPAGSAFNFAVSPIVPTFGSNNAPNQRMVVSSADGAVFRTVDGGNNWFVIGGTSGGTSDLDGTNAQALAYGAPDPNPAVNPLGQPDDFIYAGTVGNPNAKPAIPGHIFVTFRGGGQPGSTKWINLSGGLDGSSVESIAANPHPGSHEAFAVTNNGVYHMVDSFQGGNWVNLTGNLFTLINSLYGNSTASAAIDDHLFSLAVDWRTPTPTLYVGGETGVFRSTNMGATWTVFPSIAQDGAIADGGFLPHVRVVALTLSLGNIDPTRGIPNQATGPDLLVAYTDGRGAFAIRLSNTLHNGPAVASVTPSSGSPVSSLTVLFNKTVDPSTFTPADVVLKNPSGTVIPITSIVVQDNPSAANPTGLQQTYLLRFAPQTATGTYTITIGPNVRDYTGAAMDQDEDGIDGGSDDAFTGQFAIGKASASVAPAAVVKPASASPLLVTEESVAGAAQFTVFAAGSPIPLFSFGPASGAGSGAVIVSDDNTGAKLGTIQAAHFLDEVMAAAAQGAIIPDPADNKLRVHSFAPNGAILDEFFTEFDGLVGAPLAELRPKKA
jgi:subtilisin-like proprotein convertase family protein